MSLSRQSEWQVSRREWRRERWRLFRREAWILAFAFWGYSFLSVLVGGVVGVFLAVIVSLEFSPHAVPEWIASILALSLVSAVVAAPCLMVRSIWRADLEKDKLREVQEIVSMVDDNQAQYLVDVQYVDGGAVGGRDSGVLWFEGDRMHFVGRYSDFSLTPRELHRWSVAQGLERFGEGVLAVHLLESGLIGHRKIAIKAMDSRRWRELAEEARRFEELPVSKERGQLPPIGLGPEAGPFRMGWATWWVAQSNPVFGPKPGIREIGVRVGEFAMFGTMVWILGFMIFGTGWKLLLILIIYGVFFWHPTAIPWIASYAQFVRLKEADIRRLERARRDALRDAPYRKLGTPESEK